MINKEHISGIFITKFSILDFKMDADMYNKDEVVRYGHRITNFLLETNGEKEKDSAKVKLSLDFSFKFENKDYDSPFVLLNISTSFVTTSSIINEYIKDIEDHKVIDGVFIDYIYKLIYDTARGILIAKTEGTSFSKFIMPHLLISNGPFEIKMENPSDDNQLNKKV